MNKKHQKHAKLARPIYGQFGRNEISILGTPCGEIKALAAALTQKLSDQYRTAYIDADHKSGDDPASLEGNFLQHGSQLAYTDKIDFQRFDFQEKLDDFKIKALFNEQDLIIINGNHFEAAKQIIVIDPRKPLEKKLDKMTNVQLIVLHEEASEVPLFLKAHLSNFEQIPVLKWTDTTGIGSFVENMLKASTPIIKGLVLAGGKSERMQRDKTLIEYHGKAQRDFMFGMLEDLTDSAFYSVRNDQEGDFDDATSIKDAFYGLGPYGAILSAMMKDPDSAWLVTASDQPFLTKEVLQKLIDNRNPSKVATAFYNPETDFPEPLVTLWEPRAYPILLQYLSQGYSCPRKVLINSDIELLKLDDASVLGNVNTPDEYKLAKQQLGN